MAALSASSMGMATGQATLTLTWPAKYAALQAIWAALPSSMTTAQKLGQVNGMVVPGPPQNVSRTAIQKILQSQGTLTALQAYITSPVAIQPALTAANYILTVVTYEITSLGDTLQTSNPAYLAAIQSFGPSLLADPNTGMTEAGLTQIMNLIFPGIPWWQANGFTQAVCVFDLVSAGNLF